MIKKYECVMQDGIKDCGVCSLLTIIKTYGGDVSKEYLRVLTNTTKDGTNAMYLFEAAKTLGFETKALKGNIKDLDKSMLPCIAHVIINKSYKHFVVIHEIKILWRNCLGRKCRVRCQCHGYCVQPVPC